MIRIFQSAFNQTEYWISITSTPESKRWVLNYLQNHNNLKSGIISHLLYVFFQLLQVTQLASLEKEEAEG